MSSFEHRTQIRVRYAETDQMGVVWHGNYIEYFEAARTETLRDRGSSYRALEESGVMMPVVEVGVQYHKPARYDDLLTVVTSIAGPPGARMRFEYRVLDEAGELVASGFTTLAFIAAATRRPCRPPAALRALFE